MNKDEKLFLSYYQEFKDKIFNYIWYRVNHNRCLAEDLTSEIFIKALDKFDTFNKDRPFQSWIYKIAKNHLLNHYRSANREVDLSCARNVIDDCSESVELNIEAQDILDKINKLDTYQKDVLLMRYVDQLSNKEIAEILNKNEGAIRTQISRALASLKKDIEC